MTAPRSARRRVLAILVGLVAGAALLEAGLRVAGLVAGEGRRPLDTAAPAGARVILFAGDSHTFGLWVDAEESLPNRTAKVLRECGIENVAAVNAGRAGAPSWSAVDEAERCLPDVKPQVVVYRAGVNNLLVEDPRRAGFWDELRIVKLGRILAYNLKGAAEAPRPRVGARRDELAGGARASTESGQPRLTALTSEELGERIAIDLTRLSALTKAARARLYVLGYLDARGDLGNASAALEGAASRLGIPFVDLRSVAREAEVAGPREEYLQHDGHPRPLGYGMEALELARVLREREGLGGSAPEGAVAWYRRVRLDSTAGRPAMGAELERADSEGGVILIVKTEPMRTGWLIVGRESAAKPLGTLDVPIDFEDAARIGAQTRLTFDTDATGVARVKLPREVLAWTEERLYAAAVLHAMPDASSALVHSKVMDVKTGAAATRQIRSR